jgi:hypothetical protein
MSDATAHVLLTLARRNLAKEPLVAPVTASEAAAAQRSDSARVATGDTGLHEAHGQEVAN